MIHGRPDESYHGSSVGGSTGGPHLTSYISRPRDPSQSTDYRVGIGCDRGRGIAESHVEPGGAGERT